MSQKIYHARKEPKMTIKFCIYTEVFIDRSNSCNEKS